MRTCKDCEYYQSYTNSTEAGQCWYNPPTISGTGKSLNLKTGCPSVNKDHYCSKWEPKWEYNEALSKAWDDFQLLLKMTRDDK